MDRAVPTDACAIMPSRSVCRSIFTVLDVFVCWFCMSGHSVTGFQNVAFYYLFPWMIVNVHLVLITYLQHTDVYVQLCVMCVCVCVCVCVPCLIRSLHMPVGPAGIVVVDRVGGFSYIPHFRAKEYTWLRGALCTVDRSFGPLLNWAFHHIHDTHVCHHLFSKMPFYHAEEATVRDG